MKCTVIALIIITFSNISLFYPTPDVEKSNHIINAKNFAFDNGMTEQKLIEKISNGTNFVEVKDGLPQKENLTRPLAMIDSDRNGYPELILLTPGSDGKLFLFEWNNGSFINKTIIDTPHTPSDILQNPLYVTDLQGDGIYDIIAGEYWLSGAENGTFVQNTTILANSEPPWIGRSLAPGDVDSDGDIDFIVSNGRGVLYGLWALLNLNGSTFKNELSWRRGLPPYRSPYYYGAFDMKLKDVNNDGWLDLVTTMGNNGWLEPDKHEARAYFVWVSDGTGMWYNSSTGFPAGSPTLLIVGYRWRSGHIHDLFKREL